MSDQTSAGQSGSFSEPPSPATPQQPVARLAQPAAPPPSASTAPAAGQGPPAEPPEEEKETRWWAWILAILLLLLLLGLGLWYFFGREEATPPVVVTPTTSTPVTPTTTPPVTASPSVSQTPGGTPTIGTVAVPDILGKTAEEADQILRDAGFTKVTFSSGNPEDPVQILSEWKVTGQTPGAGEQVTPDTELVITVERLGCGKG